MEVLEIIDVAGVEVPVPASQSRESATRKVPKWVEEESIED